MISVRTLRRGSSRERRGGVLEEGPLGFGPQNRPRWPKMAPRGSQEAPKRALLVAPGRLLAIFWPHFVFLVPFLWYLRVPQEASDLKTQ